MKHPDIPSEHSPTSGWPQRSRAGMAIAAAAALSVLGSASESRADVISMNAEVRGGGSAGQGFYGDQQDDAFHKGVTGGAYGVAVGAEILFIDVWIAHDQFLGSGGVDGTWTQFMTGFDVEMDLGEKKGGHFDDQGKQVGGYASWYGELGLGAGFGVGTGQQVDPPLDNSQVTDKGFLVEGRAGVGYHLTRHLTMGLVVPVQTGYYTKSGNGAFANDLDNHYVSMSAAALLNLRFKLTIK